MALALALCLAAPPAALASNAAASDVTVVAAGFWPAQETFSVDLDSRAGAFSKTSDAASRLAMLALAATAASSAVLLALAARRGD